MTVELLYVLPILLASVVLHEYAHAWVADREGDPTARRAGRLTLNPVVHFDPIGSLLVPVAMWVGTGGSAVIGWARPVPVDPRNYRDPRGGDLRVSAAGVAANFALAVAFVGLAVLAVHTGRAVPTLAPVMQEVVRAAQFGLLINILLGVFNLVPIPPLDGSHLLYHALPPSLRSSYRALGRFGLLLLFVIVLVPGLLDLVLWPVWKLYDLANLVVRLGV